MSGTGIHLGHYYPPQCAAEVAAYDLDDLHQGYSEFVVGDELPGENHSAAYRWGALNRQRDRSGTPDGFDHLRHAAIAASSRS